MQLAVAALLVRHGRGCRRISGHDIDQSDRSWRREVLAALQCADLAAALMKASRVAESHIHDVQKLIGDGLSQRPDCDEYALGLMLLFANDRTRSKRTSKNSFRKRRIPGLKEGVAANSRCRRHAGREPYVGRQISAWRQVLGGAAGRAQCKEGVYPRALLIDKALVGARARVESSTARAGSRAFTCVARADAEGDEAARDGVTLHCSAAAFRPR